MHVLSSCDKRIGEDCVHLLYVKMRQYILLVLYFGRATKEAVVTIALDAMENRLYRTVLHRCDASLSNHSSVFPPKLFSVCIPPRYADLPVVCTSLV